MWLWLLVVIVLVGITFFVSWMTGSFAKGWGKKEEELRTKEE